MKNVRKSKWKPIFTLAHLKELPPEFQNVGEKLRTVYVGFENLAPVVLRGVGIDIGRSYSKFLKNDASDLTAQTWATIGEIGRSEVDEKAYWLQKSLHLVMGSIIMGHDKIDQAYQCLKLGKVEDFAGKLSEAGVYFGRLTMINDLNERDSFNLIGSVQSALSGAALGGIKSGASRRRQSRVPSPEALRNARQKLVDAGKPPREISAMLAKKYHCTTDYIRKVLKQD